MNEMNIHTIADLQRYVRSYGLPKLPIRGLVRSYEHGLEALPGKPTPSIKDHMKAKTILFLKIWREMGRELKVVIFCVEILLYH